jgi:hypothetical protein
VNNQTKTQFIAVATITSELSAVVTIAKEISLAAANAKAIAFRAGDQAKGFQPITDFISDMAKETIEKVAIINELAIRLYQVTVMEFRMAVSYSKFDEVTKRSISALYGNTMQKPLDNTKNTLRNYRRQFKRDVISLLTQLETVMHNAQTARVIATYSRIEASQAGEYLHSLQAVAESVDNAAQTIHENVQRCITALSSFAK